MQRHTTVERIGWDEEVRRNGLVYVDTIDPATGRTFSYWTEDAYYHFSSPEQRLLEMAAKTLNQMYIEAGDYVIDNNLFHLLGIPSWAVPAIKWSWDDGNCAPSMIGRYDFFYNGEGPPKLYEYNADTPTALPESAITQCHWWEQSEAGRNRDQWNRLWPALIEGWQRQIQAWEQRTGRKAKTIHFAFTTADTSREDEMNVWTIANTAQEAGYKVKIIPMESIRFHSEGAAHTPPMFPSAPGPFIAHSLLQDGSTAETGWFFDADGEPIEIIFKLYPWEWMIEEKNGKPAFWNMLQPKGTLWIEPPYKAMWSNKGMLAILWKLFGKDPARNVYLLPTYFEGEHPAGFERNCARKPLLGREGANVTLTRDGEVIATKGGTYGKEGFILQELCPLPRFDGEGGPFRPLVSVWMIDNYPEGLCIRETLGEGGHITDNLTRFVPHTLEVSAS